jgi:hypothetical protein
MRLFFISLLLLFPVMAMVAQDTPIDVPTETPVVTATDLPSPTATLTLTATPSATATETPTVILTETPSLTPSPTATPTAIVQTVVVPVVITSPPMVIIATAPPAPTAVPATAVPATSAPPPAAASGGGNAVPTLQTPFYGWRRYQSIHFVPVIGTWAIQSDYAASARQYRRSSDVGAIARYPFTGDGVRLAYQVAPTGCAFDLVVDEVVIARFDSYADELGWRLAGPYFLSNGYHVLDIRSLASTPNVCSVGFDYIDVFTNVPLPESAQAVLNPPTPVPALDVARVVLVSAPATLAPTLTPIPAGIVALTVIVAYDANASETADIGEGVVGMSVRLLDAASGELLQSGFTDDRGQLNLQAVSRDPLIITIPLLGETLTLNPTLGQTITQRWEVVLPPANQPGVIP